MPLMPEDTPRGANRGCGHVKTGNAFVTAANAPGLQCYVAPMGKFGAIEPN
jgi:hypothetical protein